MRKEYDFSQAIPFAEWRRRRRRSTGVDSSRESELDVAPLTRAQIRELDRRVRDAKDRTRFLLASVMGHRFVLYYNVSEDNYAHNDPRYATLFKRRAAAEAVRQQLGAHIQLIRCRANAKGQLILASLPRLRARGSARRGKGAV